MQYTLFAAAIGLSPVLALAVDTIAPAGKPECQVVNDSPRKGEWITWSGPCKDGFAHGTGVLEWIAGGELKSYYSGDMARGIEYGQGYFKNRFGMEYEGGFKDGKYDGQGTLLNFDGRYDGKWKDGKRHGLGRMVFTLGGRYEGMWKDDLFHGKGEIIYVSGRKAVAVFEAGRIAGTAAGPSLPGTAHRLVPTRTGMRLAHETSTSLTPYTGDYAGLTAAEKAIVHAPYLLDENDEPPYPEDGTKSIHNAMAKLRKAYPVSGPLLMRVKVDAEGKAIEVSAPATPDEKVMQYGAAVLMKTKYKPARCGGKPCEMNYVYSTNLEGQQ